ncbi:MAG: hypothetical protein C0624_08790 [Desulfuromonas sp.]|nr:MAG: hypothetical protein C0624_08790 [Desulfuromonas sp.]
MHRKPITLKVKILTLVLVTVMIAMGVVTWVGLSTQDSILRLLGQEHCRVLAETANERIVTLMRAGNHEKLHSLLHQVKHQNTLDKLYIFDEQGNILSSSDTADVDRVLPPTLLRQLIDYSDRRPLVGNDGIFYSVKTIKNQQSCHQCHDPALANLGRVNVVFSLDYLESLRRKGFQTSLMTFVSLLVLAVAALSTFFFFYVENPIRMVINAMRRLEEGAFDSAQLSINSSYEMSQVADKFNAMAHRLQELISTKVQQENELFQQQEQLAHQQELQAMNVTLEDRLKEIEHLNISLEERIEEIEEANFKIADLAGELESKNTSLEQTVERLSAIYKMGLAINATKNISALFELLLQKSLETLNAKVGYILLLNAEQRYLSVAACTGIPQDLPGDFCIPLNPGSVSRWVIEQGEALLIQDINESKEFNHRSLLGFDRESVMCAPLKIKNEAIGTLTIANKQDGSRFAQEDLEMVSTIAAQASVAINNARLYEEQQQTYLCTVQALVSAIEANDSYTRGHSERVTRYAMAIAEEMSLSAGALRELEQAAILHDIGKIGIDINLLHKKDKLDKEDVYTLQKHPEIGQRILEPIHFLCSISDIVAQHHERFDGAGYPGGLEGNQILLEARILAVADTFDAMTSNRPYRTARLREEAITEIRRMSGSQFDPSVVSAFLRVYDNDAAA